jgi:small subunit ribosomal protein S8e
MGIGRDSRHKHRATGGKRNIHQKKRKFEMGRPPSMTKIGVKRVRTVRCRGGNMKVRALRLDTGNFSWGSENTTRKCKIMDVVYNASNNELVRTKTIVKNCIVQVDASLFKQWYLTHYGVDLSKKKKGEKAAASTELTGSRHALALKAGRAKMTKLDQALQDQFASGRLLAAISSRPGQSGRADGYILEGEELTFYKKKMEKKKKN